MTFGITEPWPGYPPELNAGRMESGVGAPTWVASGEMWSVFCGLVGEAIAAMLAEIASVTANWNGPAAVQLSVVTAPYFGWLSLMEATAAFNAISCISVVQAYSLATGTMIPVPAVNANRVAELTAEATNFFGVNAGTILFLNQQYGQYWVQNANNMVTYDEAVQIATIPKPSSPPPPLSDVGQALSTFGEAAAMSPSSLTDPLMSALQQTSQTGTGAQSPVEMLQNVMSSAPQMLQAPGQFIQQAGSSLGSPAQSLMSPFQSLLSQFGGSAEHEPALTGTGPAALAFPASHSAPAAQMTGTPVGGGYLGGGLTGGTMLGNYPGSGNPIVKSQQVFTGVPTGQTRPEIRLASTPTAAPMGGGMPMMPGAGAALGSHSSGTQRRDSDLVISLNPVGGASADRRT